MSLTPGDREEVELTHKFKVDVVYKMNFSYGYIARLSKSVVVGAGKIAQWLKIWTALAEGQSSIPSTCMVVHSHL